MAHFYYNCMCAICDVILLLVLSHRHTLRMCQIILNHIQMILNFIPIYSTMWLIPHVGSVLCFGLFFQHH